MQLVLVTPPDDWPVSLTEARRQCRVGDEDDQRLLGHIRAATAYLDGYHGMLGRCIITQTWRMTSAGWGIFRLPVPDVVSADLSYIDASGAQSSLPLASYYINSLGAASYVTFAPATTFPALHADTPEPVTVTFTAGFGGPDDVPPQIKDAILLHVEALYDRLPDEQWRPAYEHLIAPLRVGNL